MCIAAPPGMMQALPRSSMGSPLRRVSRPPGPSDGMQAVSSISSGGRRAVHKQHSHQAATLRKAACTAARKATRSGLATCSTCRSATCSSTACGATAGNTDAGAMSSFFNMLGQMMQQGQTSQATPSGAALGVGGVSYHPPGAGEHFHLSCAHHTRVWQAATVLTRRACAGTPAPLLKDISMQLPANSMGLIYGSSGSVRTF
jgi:hypothetical protein